MAQRLEMDAEFLTTTLNWILNCPTKHLATRVLEETIRQMLTIELAHWGFQNRDVDLVTLWERDGNTRKCQISCGVQTWDLTLIMDLDDNYSERWEVYGTPILIK